MLPQQGGFNCKWKKCTCGLLVLQDLRFVDDSHDSPDIMSAVREKHSVQKNTENTQMRKRCINTGG